MTSVLKTKFVEATRKAREQANTSDEGNRTPPTPRVTFTDPLTNPGKGESANRDPKPDDGTQSRSRPARDQGNSRTQFRSDQGQGNGNDTEHIKNVFDAVSSPNISREEKLKMIMDLKD